MTQKTKDYLQIGQAVLILAAVIILLISFFKPSVGSPDKGLYDQLVAAKNESIALLRAQNEILKEQRVEFIADAQAAERRDSILISKISLFKPQYQTVKVAYEQIPNRIRAIAGSADSIRAAFKSY